jgi:hypothetical protein
MRHISGASLLGKLHSSLLRNSVNYGRKSFKTLGPRVGIYKELMKEKVGLTKNIFRTKSSTVVKYFRSKLATQRKNLQVNELRNKPFINVIRFIQKGKKWQMA